MYASSVPLVTLKAIIAELSKALMVLFMGSAIWIASLYPSPDFQPFSSRSIVRKGEAFLAALLRSSKRRSSQFGNLAEVSKSHTARRLITVLVSLMTWRRSAKTRLSSFYDKR